MTTQMQFDPFQFQQPGLSGMPGGYGSMGGWGNAPQMPQMAKPVPMGGAGFGTDISAFAGAAAPAAAANPGVFGGMFDNFFNKAGPDGTMAQGWGGQAMGVGQGLFNAYLGMKQYGLYKDQLAESKKQFGLNYEAQRTTTNSALEDRQRARVASNSGAYESVGSYMDKNSIKGG